MRVISAAAFVGLLMLTFVSTASARIDTTTRGNVCCPFFDGELENFGGYTFRGKTTPTRTGQFVKFQYKRPWAHRWRSFKVGLGGSDGLAFYVLNKDAPRDRINGRDRWSVFFTPSVRRGNWKIRAAFPRQGEHARSHVVKKYWVRESD